MGHNLSYTRKMKKLSHFGWKAMHIINHIIYAYHIDTRTHLTLYTYYIMHRCCTTQRSYSRKRPKFQLTHSKTRINPKGSFNTWNVPADTSCKKGDGFRRKARFHNSCPQLTTKELNITNEIHKCRGLDPVSLDSPDQWCPFLRHFLSH